MTPPPAHPEQLLSQVKSLRRLAQVLIGNRAEAEDLVQDTLVLALERPRLETEGLGAWLRGVLRKKAQHRYRSESARERREAFSARGEALPATADLVARKAQLGTLVEEVLDLPEPYQSALYLRYFEDKSLKRIAHELGSKEGTVSSQIHRGLELLRDRLDTRAGGDRSAWVSALLPFVPAHLLELSPTTGGLLMAGKLKLVAAAVILGSFLYVASKQETPLSEGPALTPDASLAGSPMERAAIEVPEQIPKVTPQPIAAEDQVAQVPADSPVSPVDSKPATPSEAERLQALGYVDDPPPVESPPELWDAIVERSFQLSLVFDHSPDEPIIVIEDDGSQRLNFEGSYDQLVEVVDTYGPLNAQLKPDFVRRMTGAWSSTFPEYGAIAEGRPTVHKGSSPLVGRDLLFHWNPVPATYSVDLKTQRSGDEKRWTMDLEEDMDLRGLCPPPRVQPDQNWQVELESLEGLFQPGGEIELIWNGREQSTLASPNGWADFLIMDKGADGDRTCVLSCVRRVDSGTKSEVEFQMRLKSKHVVNAAELASRSEYTGPAGDLTFELDLRGRGVWSEAGQRVSELELAGPFRLEALAEVPGGDVYRIRFLAQLELQVTNTVR